MGINREQKLGYNNGTKGHKSSLKQCLGVMCKLNMGMYVGISFCNLYVFNVFLTNMLISSPTLFPSATLFLFSASTFTPSKQ